MAMSLQGGRGRARRGGGTRDLQWVDNKPQSSSRCVRVTLCSPQFSLSLSPRNWQIRKSTSGISSRASSLSFSRRINGIAPSLSLPLLSLPSSSAKCVIQRARAYAITSASVHQARRGEDIPFWRYHTRDTRSANSEGKCASREDSEKVRVRMADSDVCPAKNADEGNQVCKRPSAGANHPASANPCFWNILNPRRFFSLRRSLPCFSGLLAFDVRPNTVVLHLDRLHLRTHMTLWNVPA